MSRFLRPGLIALAVLLSGAVALLLGWGLDNRAHDGRAARNVLLVGQPVGGMTTDELQEVVSGLADDYAGAQVNVAAGAGAFTLTTDDLGVELDPQATIRAVLDVGRTGAVPGSVWSWATSPLRARVAPVRLTADELTMRAAVAEADPGPRTAPVEPSVTFTDGAFVAVEGKAGQGIDPAEVLEGLQAKAGEGVPISLRVRRGSISPRFTLEDARRLAGDAQGTVTRSLQVTAGRTSARVALSTIRTWVTTTPGAHRLELALNAGLALDDLGRLLPNAGDPPTNAAFSVSGGTVSIANGKNGETCCAPEAIPILSAAALHGGGDDDEIELPLRVEAPKLTLAEARELKIVEAVATFTTRHPAGQSRVVNIHRIADMLRGTVIQPGDTFSVNTAVGRRTTAKGFVTGGVIEDGVFAEDIGGGISQFATTLFNAAFFGGLEVPEYQAHTIYISRYPYGREATLSFPKPDLKIKNTSPHGVLLWPTYSGTSITVTLYSTKWVAAEQTAQTTAPSGNCTRVATTRTRTWLDGTTETDKFFALYHPGEGVNC